MPEDIFGGIPIPTTEEGIRDLEDEFDRTNDLDRLLALIRALLLQGERGYPRLTRLFMRVAGKAQANGFQEEDLLRKVVPALKLAMRHERELVGYVGYLLTDENVPPLLRTGAMGAAMFLSVNRTPGSEEFGPILLERFMQRGAMGGGDQDRMLIEAMGFLRQGQAVDPLLAMLRDPQRENMHGRAIEALGRIGDERAVGPLIQRLRAKPTGETQWWSGRAELQALARIGTPEALAAAEQHLANLSNDDAFFAQASGYLRARPSDKVVGMIRDRFRNNPGANNLWGAIYGLRASNTPAALATLEEIAANSTHEHMRNTAARFVKEKKEQAAQMEGLER